MCNFARMINPILIADATVVLQAMTTSSNSKLTSYLLWGVGAVLVSVAVVLLFMQQRTGRQLRFELKQLKKVKKHNIEYEFVLKAMNLSTWHIDAPTRKIYFDNDYRSNTDNYAPAQGTPFSALAGIFAEKDRDRVLRVVDDLCEGRTEELHETYQVRIAHSNSYYWEESYATVAKRNDEGKPLNIVGTSMRIDDRKTMEEALVAARNKAEESDRLKSAFIANMSHEIRTPLNAIIGFTSLLPDVSGDNERRQLIELIQENNQKLLRIIDDVMNISKIEAGNDELQLSTFDLNIKLSEWVGRYAEKAAPGVSVITHFPQGSLNITTDQKRLQEIMNHLLSNATKFTKQGSIVTSYDTSEDKLLRITVHDTGIGIPADALPRVFERFFKVNEFVPGAGLGLSTCRTMAYSLGGSVGAESELGKGSTFWLEIPV
jgi:signal transduction histidine kinase